MFSLTLFLSVCLPCIIFLICLFRYKISQSDQYIVRTGFLIDDIIISKKAFVFPFQSYIYIDLNPKNYSFNLNAMSVEKIDFILPGVFIIGPKNDKIALQNYARLLSNYEDVKGIDPIILGIMEGETRLIASKMTIDEIFDNRELLRNNITQNVQKELDKFGLHIYNANIKELCDVVGNQYFSYLKQKKISHAENMAKIDIAEAKKLGDIGQKEREVSTRKEIMMLEADANQFENESRKKIEASNATLTMVQSDTQHQIKLRDLEMRRNFEQLSLEFQKEKLRAETYSVAQIQSEIKLKETETSATTLKIQSDANFYAKTKELETQQAMRTKQIEMVSKCFETFKYDPNLLLNYMMFENGLYEKLSETNAKAIQGLQPKITIWNTDKSQSNPISDIFKMLPPLVTTIHDQTGVKMLDNVFKVPS